MMTTAVEHRDGRLRRAVQEARRIRRNLVRLCGETELDGFCALASVTLAAEIGDMASLRHNNGPDTVHVWNVVRGTIIDITATQFNVDVDEPVVRGVLITRRSRIYHRGNVGRGRETADFLMGDPFYTGDLWDRMARELERLGIDRVEQAACLVHRDDREVV